MRTGGWAGKMVLLFLILVLSVGCAQAGISYGSGQRIILADMPDADIIDVYNTLSPTYGNLLLYPDPETPTIWYVNRTITVDRSNFTLSPERGVTEIRIDNSLGGNQGYTIFGTPGAYEGVIINGITYTGWDMLNNTPRATSQKTLEISKGHVNNTIFKNVSTVLLYNTFDTHMSNLTLLNGSGSIKIKDSSRVSVTGVTIYDSVGTLTIENTTYSNFQNIYAEHIDRYGVMSVAASDYNYFKNVTVIDVADYLDYATGYYGFSTNNCNYTTVYDLYLNGSGWSTLAPGGYFGYYENCTILNSGHNSIDLHNVRDSTFINCSLYAPYTNESYADGKTNGVNNVLMTAGISTALHTSNITMKDIYCFNRGFLIENGVDHIYLENITMDGEGPAIAAYVDYFTLKNFTLIPNPGAPLTSKITLWYSDLCTERGINNTLIDGSFYWLSAQKGTRNRLLNVKYMAGNYKNHTEYYYGDVAVKTGTGTPLSGTVTFTNENTTNSKFSSTDSLAENKQTFNVTTGRTLLPDSNRIDSAAIADTWNDPNGTVINFEQTVAVTTPQGSVTLDNINPDSRWYRTNPQQSKYTITALINDSGNLHFTGYSPTPEYNTFESGDSVKFQVWTDEPLTQVVWKKDGVELQNSTSTTYEATISDAPITVDILGESANGSISKTWVVDPEHVIDPTPDPGVLAPVANFTANATSGAYPLRISFTDGSENIPTHWYWDFDNDGVTDSTLQNATYKYKAKGNYTVKLVVSNTNNTDFETKTAYINVTGTAPTKRITHSILGYFYNIFYQIFGLGAWLA